MANKTLNPSSTRPGTTKNIGNTGREDTDNARAVANQQLIRRFICPKEELGSYREEWDD